MFKRNEENNDNGDERTEFNEHIDENNNDSKLEPEGCYNHNPTTMLEEDQKRKVPSEEDSYHSANSPTGCVQEDEISRVHQTDVDDDGSNDDAHPCDYDDSTVASLKKSRYPARAPPVCAWWTKVTEDVLHETLLKWVVALSCHASRYPKRCVAFSILLSFALAGIGLATNFVVKFDHEEIFTPLGSLPAKHGKWVYGSSGFEDSSDLTMVIHANGDDVINMQAVRRIFEALDILKSTPGYEELCKTSDYVDRFGNPTCWIWSTTQFWNHDVEKFEKEVDDKSDLAFAISQSTYPDGTPVYKEASYGKYESVPKWYLDEEGTNKTYDLLTYVPSFIASVGLPDTTESELFQEVALERLKELQRSWELQDTKNNPLSIQLEFFSMHAYLLEYERALMKDMPLVPLVFYVMLLFTCYAFHKLGQNTSEKTIGTEPSRFALGILSTFTIGMSLLSGYGMMFCLGVPFTNIAQMIPFIILGVGLDDTFIISGAYFRLLSEEQRDLKRIGTSVASGNTKDDSIVITERIRETMEEVGLSVTLTTTTTVFAFCLGCMSTIPGIRWVCLYASVTIAFDFFYQLTLFIALLTLDEQRMIRARANAKKRGKYMLLGGLWTSNPDYEEDNALHSTNSSISGSVNSTSSHFTQQIMHWYAKQLLRPVTKVIVLIVFTILFGYSVYRTTLLTQEFNIEDYVPEDSYTKPFFHALDDYSTIKVGMEVYFRNVNQSDPVIQDQMRDYIDELSKLPQIQHPPDFCWVNDLRDFMTGKATEDMDEKQKQNAEDIAKAIQSGNKTFTEQLNMALKIDTIREVYGGDILRDEEGNIEASRCYLFVRYIDLHDVQEQVALLHAQEEITARFQPELTPEQERSAEGLSFFTFHDLYYYWELYTVAVEELVFTTISGVIAVCVIGFLLIPHWSAITFIFPIIVMLYFNLLGTLQFCGVYINAVTYVTVVIAIGLLVDFLMHILLRYYESPGNTREAKVIETLETIGASMLLGGFTTWLGVIPLALSSTEIFNTIFIAFIAMVSWGLLTSLILMPVILSLFGPIICTIGDRLSKKEARKIKKSKKLEKETTAPPVLHRRREQDDDHNSSANEILTGESESAEESDANRSASENISLDSIVRWSTADIFRRRHQQSQS